jgi:hypothetical protein
MMSFLGRLLREEKGDMQFLYASLALFAALAVAAGEGLTESISNWLRAAMGLIGS